MIQLYSRWFWLGVREVQDVKIEPISENRIKVILSCYDILELNFDVSSLSTDTVEARLFFKDVLKKAEEKFGFSANVDRIVVEALPSVRDGYVIYITKASEDLSLIKAEMKNKETNAVFSFIDFGTLKTAVRVVLDVFYGRSDLFVLDNKYYLVLDSVLEENFSKAEIMLTEFGEKILNSVMFESVLNEYGKLLYKKNAINMIKNQKN